jgi:hypothetical protein
LFAITQSEDERKFLDNKWEKLELTIKSKNPEYSSPPLPFQSNVLIKDFNELYAKIYDKEKFI